MDCPTWHHLNRLLKMAVLAGVEKSVRLHIQRGDNLDARDDKGMTPLMLAASKNKGGICALLISSGANPTLTDLSGRDAMAIAKAAGAAEAAITIEALMLSGTEGPYRADTPGSFGETGVTPEKNRADEAAIPSYPQAYEAEAFDNGEDGFGLCGWEAEEDGPAPEGNNALVEAAAAVHRIISAHEPIDDSEDWGDFEVFLPERAVPLPGTADEEDQVRLRNLVLRAIREGSVPERSVERICRFKDGSRNEEGEALLRLVLGEIGAETDERIETNDFRDDRTVDEDEEDKVSEALAFLDDLESGHNEPMRLYARDMRKGRLLTAEEEISLARDMEEGVASMLDALASWPEGVAAILVVAERVRAGASDVESVSTGGPVDPPADDIDTHPMDGEPIENDENEETAGETGHSSTMAREFLEWADEIRRLVDNAGKGGAGERALRAAIASANLTMAFLDELASAGNSVENEAAVRFRRAWIRLAESREHMTVSNLRLVIHVAKRYQGRGLPLDDLVQEGNLGLLKAVDRYDWHKGFRFSTYATWWIRQQITRAIADKAKTIRTPVHVHEKVLRIAREAEEIERHTGRRPSLEDLAARMSMSPWRVADLMTHMEEPLPLSEPNSDGTLPAEVLEDPRSTDPFELVARAALRKTLMDMLAELKPRAAEVLTLRFGLDGKDARTLEEIGVHFNLTRERIRQIEAKGLRWLASPFRAEILLDFLD